MRSIGCLFVSALVLSGCLLDRTPLGPVNPVPDGGSVRLEFDHDPPVLDTPFLPSDVGSIPSDEPWPRSHPIGTLLVDHDGELWMAVDGGVRMPVSGDDTLGLISMDEHDATPMSYEEERCLPPVDDYWGPPNGYWWPVYGPTEEDPGPFILDGTLHVRRPVSLEALESWGYYWRWMDYFDGGEDEWLSYAFDRTPIAIRDGTLVHTEHGFYYVVHGRSFWFNPPDLVAEAGYQPEDALWMRDSRLRELAPVSIAFSRETFLYCPADEL